MTLLADQKFPGRLILLTTAAILSLSCASGSNQSKSPAPDSDAGTVVSLTPPFKTKEPERYTAIRTVTSSTAAGQMSSRELIARDGTRRRYESELPDVGKVVYLETSGNRFVILPEARIYADMTNDRAKESNNADELEQLEANPDRLIHENATAASYRAVGSEVLNGHHCTKYRVLVNNSDSPIVSSTETLIWIDDALGMPVKTETNSAGGNRLTMELSNVSQEVDQSLFQIPGDYVKVDPATIQQRLRGLSTS